MRVRWAVSPLFSVARCVRAFCPNALAHPPGGLADGGFENFNLPGRMLAARTALPARRAGGRCRRRAGKSAAPGIAQLVARSAGRATHCGHQLGGGGRGCAGPAASAPSRRETLDANGKQPSPKPVVLGPQVPKSCREGLSRRSERQNKQRGARLRQDPSYSSLGSSWFVYFNP